VPTLFVRVAGCNLAEEKNSPCAYCDTGYSWKKDDGEPGTVEDIRSQVDMAMKSTGLRDICLTGGEPLWHEEVKDLIYWWNKTYDLTVETNGSLPIWPLPWACWSVDIKCPSSGNADYNDLTNLAIVQSKDQVKFIISDKKDYKFARKIVMSRSILAPIIFQPSWKVMPAKKLAKWLVEDVKLNRVSSVRLGMQMHKVIWPAKTRGV